MQFCILVCYGCNKITKKKNMTPFSHIYTHMYSSNSSLLLLRWGSRSSCLWCCVNLQWMFTSLHVTLRLILHHVTCCHALRSRLSRPPAGAVVLVLGTSVFAGMVHAAAVTEGFEKAAVAGITRIAAGQLVAQTWLLVWNTASRWTCASPLELYRIRRFLQVPQGLLRKPTLTRTAKAFTIMSIVVLSIDTTIFNRTSVIVNSHVFKYFKCPSNHLFDPLNKIG